ncbi:hypothetical protein CROQUDRAFT_659377 [Cronartium quercuum f. sp. fusiforme G11]|uniref:Uncharacterized protein n=1 Tax=Cronartium quercuum f. sp. fusiforme G11 TaxID=708437 RepID=A0A9P6NJX9_9BASI|nr:hypothetical protein CROQUDRAFT_659377 [Cronartium quercuum f. sp. fusiforme G11]
MRAWREFIEKNSSINTTATTATTNLNSSNGNLIIGNDRRNHNRLDFRGLEALKSKPIRSLIFLLISILIITLISASIGGPIMIKNQFLLNHSLIKPAIWSWNQQNINTIKDRWEIKSKDQELMGLEPHYELDSKTGLAYPPDINPLKLNVFKRVNATFISLVRNEEQISMMASMRGVEDRINRKLGYPWVFLNDQPFSNEFKNAVSSMTRSKVYFGLIPKEQWSYPNHIDQTKASDERKKMENEKVVYGGSESYRHMCRFNSGFFYRHPLMMQFDYYWRVEPGVEFYCDVDYDPFLFMQENKKKYGFTISLYEFKRTIESLWSVTQEFLKLYPHFLHPENSLGFLVDDIEKGLDAPYNLCHFWSNFEIGDLRFWRSEAYQTYFNFLDLKGGFFYERWGDAPIHSIAVSLFLPFKALHQFNDIAYRHQPFMHCPTNLDLFHRNGKCFCDPNMSFDYDNYSCMKRWWKIGGDPNS